MERLVLFLLNLNSPGNQSIYTHSSEWLKFQIIVVWELDCYPLQAKSPTPKAGGPPVNVPPPPCAPYCPLPGQVTQPGPGLILFCYISAKDRKKRKNCERPGRYWLWADGDEVRQHRDVPLDPRQTHWGVHHCKLFLSYQLTRSSSS